MCVGNVEKAKEALQDGARNFRTRSVCLRSGSRELVFLFQGGTILQIGKCVAKVDFVSEVIVIFVG